MKHFRLKIALGLGTILIIGGSLFLYSITLPRLALLPDASATVSTDEAPVANRLIPPPLTPLELAYQRWFSSITWQLPEERRDEHWNIGGRQHNPSSIRYHAAMVGYAAAALGMRTPAYRGETCRIIGNTIERLLDERTWAYSADYWKETSGDPCAQENIMYTGHLLHLLALYEAWTGESRYRTAGFDFVSNGKSVHYDTMKLARSIVRQMQANPSGGVTCEPGLIFFPCNNHPQAGLLLLEKMGLGQWKSERHKWEEWSLNSYRARVGDGLVRLFYHQPSEAFCPIGLPGGDGWSILWYAPWAHDVETPRRLWREARGKFDLDTLLPRPSAHKTGDPKHSGDPKDPSLGGSYFAPLPPSLSFLAAAARACGDPATAHAMEQWLDGRYLQQHDGKAWLAVDPQWRIAVTANRALSLALEQGSDLRRLTQHPPERAAFLGPMLEEVAPSSLSVRQAYRDGNHLKVELWHPDGPVTGAATLRLANVAEVLSVAPLAKSDWSFQDGRLHLKNPGSALLSIEVVSSNKTQENASASPLAMTPPSFQDGATAPTDRYDVAPSRDFAPPAPAPWTAR